MRIMIERLVSCFHSFCYNQAIYDMRSHDTNRRGFERCWLFAPLGYPDCFRLMSVCDRFISYYTNESLYACFLEWKRAYPYRIILLA
jgi:hypothetical protein